MTRGRPRGSTGPTYGEVARRFDAGTPPVRIAADLNITKQRVYQVLQAAGRDTRARHRAARERFAAAWNVAASPAEAAAALGLTPERAAAKAKELRRLGWALKRMPGHRGPQPGVKARRIEELHKGGWGAAAIARAVGTTRAAVYDVVCQMRKRGRRGPVP